MYQPWLQRVVDRKIDTETLTKHIDEQDISISLIDMVLAADHGVRTYSRVPTIANEGLIAAVLPALEVLAGAINSGNHKLLTQALQCFLIIPQFALIKAARDTVSSQDIARQLLEFGEGRLKKQSEEKSRASVDNGQGDSDKALVKALNQVKHFGNEGRYAKASRGLAQAVSGRRGALEPTEEVVAQLKQLHPPASHTPNKPPDISPIDNNKLKKAANKIANGSAADVFGWTGELIRQLVQDIRTRPHLAKLVCAIRDGEIPEEAREWLLASWLVPLDKGEGKVRPIAGGTILVKLTASYVMETASARAKAIFSQSGTQCGLFMKGGATAAAQFTQLSLDRDPSHISIKVDFTNAFNTIPRKFLLDQLYDIPELTPFFRLAHWAYHQPSHLLLRNAQGNIAAVLQSAEGVRQGCVLGSLTYGVATLPMLTRLKESSKDIETLAFLDDVNITGAQQPALRAFEMLRQEAAEMGIRLQYDKCEILLPAVGELLQEVQQAVDNYGLRTHRGAFSLLGTVVGNNAARMKELVEEKVDKWGKALELLTRKEVPAQLALLVARWSMVAKPNYLMRSLPPSLTTDALRNHDNTIIRVVEERLQLHFTDTAKKLLQLPIRQGGVGFCSAADVAEHAFVAGTLASQIALLSFSNLYQHRFESFSEGLLLKELHKSLARYRASPLDWPGKEHMTTVETFFNHFGNKEKSHKLQARLTSTLREHQDAQFKCAAGREDIARMECRANKASALVWRAFPLTTDFRLTDEETSFAVAYATGLTPPYMPDQCSCKEGQPLTLEHSVHCLEKLTRHNMIQGRLVSFAREHGVATEQNTRLTFEDCKERKEPDIVFYPGNCPAIQTDVTVTTPAPQAGSAAAPDRTTGRSRRPWPEKPRSTAPAPVL